MIIRDFKGRAYKLIEISNHGTLLECIDDNSRIRVRNDGWDDIGFIKP